MKTIYINFLQQIYPDNVENYTEIGNNSLIGEAILNRIFNVKILRAIGVQYCWVTTRQSKVQLISIIWNYFKTRIYYPPPLEGQLLPDAIIDRTPTPLLTRHNDTHTISSMRPHYSFDREVMNRELMRNNIIIRNLISDFDAVEEDPVPVVEEDPVPVVEEDPVPEEEPDLIQSYLGEVSPVVVRRYNITPTFVFKAEEDDAEDDKEFDCPICYESYKCVNLITLNCSHQFCGDCIATILERHDINITHNPTCALCRAFMSSFDIQNIEVYNLLANRCRHLNL
jgi:hypothetical protein